MSFSILYSINLLLLLLLLYARLRFGIGDTDLFFILNGEKMVYILFFI